MAQTKSFMINDYPVIIGIDFGMEREKFLRAYIVTKETQASLFFFFTLGTTFSGASYAFAQNDEVVDIVRWYDL